MRRLITYRGTPSLFFPADSGRTTGPIPARGRPDDGAGDSSAGLDVGELRAAFYFTKGLAESSQKTYIQGSFHVKSTQHKA